jgi:hypothetical protein
MLNLNNIKPQIGYYLAGFADGEGSLMVVARNRPDYRQKWKISLCFNVAQKESFILAQFKKHLQCGTLRQRPDGVFYYEVNNFNAIMENIIPFFNRFNFISQNKKKQFMLFKQAAEIIKNGEHLKEEGFKRIISIRNKMNNGGKIRNNCIYNPRDYMSDSV